MAEIKIAADAGGGWTSLKGPANTSNQNAFVLPSADGSAGQLLKTDGSKNLSFTTVTDTVGVSEADQWRITSDVTGGADPLTSNWERNDTGFDKVGTGMSESSGVFTFPSTGIWLVDVRMGARLNGDSNMISVFIKFTTNNSSYSNYFGCISFNCI